MSKIHVIRDLNPTTYRRHALHATERAWVEKNCYVDVWIEVIHALGLEPLAIMPFTASIDFEGDQWTFFKPSHDELRELYGFDVQELNVWRPLLEHAAEYLATGRLISTEADAFWLPDTSGTDYRRQHTKSTIVLNELDIERQRLGYFHNAGYFHLDGEDFAQTFRINAPHDPAFMPLFAELVRIDRVNRRPLPELADLSRTLWRRHLQRRPEHNPVHRFQEHFEKNLPGLQEKGLDFYHAWAFATIRQLGAAFESAALNLRWLATAGIGVPAAADAFESISTTAKGFILKGARAANKRRPFESSNMFNDMASAWDRGMSSLAGL